VRLGSRSAALAIVSSFARSVVRSTVRPRSALAWSGFSNSSNAVSVMVSELSRTGVMRAGPQMKNTSGSRPAGIVAPPPPISPPVSAPASSPSSDEPTGCINISIAAIRGEIPSVVVSGPPFSRPSVASSSSLTV
jgi:hypothetical protein